jgi:hypothetical protein
MMHFFCQPECGEVTIEILPDGIRIKFTKHMLHFNQETGIFYWA